LKFGPTRHLARVRKEEFAQRLPGDACANLCPWDQDPESMFILDEDPDAKANFCRPATRGG